MAESQRGQDEASRPGATHSELSGSSRDTVQARDISGGIHFHTKDSTEAALLPQQLPSDVRGFVNRLDELGRLDIVLGDSDSAGLTVLVGTAGVGKTSLAVRWANRIRERFPDGQLYVNLRGYDPGEPVSANEALERFLRALGVSPERIPAAEEARAEMFRSFAAGRRMLIVLDNAAAVAQVRPLLPGSQTCRVLVTSRSSLSGLVARDGAHRVSVTTLSSAESVRLLQETTSDYRHEDPQEELAELARLCAYLPLALRIAAERAAARPRMPLPELIADLRDESALWDALSTGDDDAAAVRTVFAWSYRALPEEAARLFRRLGLHPSPEFGLPVAAALAELPTSRTRRLLDALVDAHLLEDLGLGRYQFHDLLRAYAADQAHSVDTVDERTDAIRRILMFYVRTASNAAELVGGSLYVLSREDVLSRDADQSWSDISVPVFSDAEAAVAWYEAERTNLMAAVRAAGDIGFHRASWQIPVLVKEIGLRADPLNTWIELQRAGGEAARSSSDAFGEAAIETCFAVDERLARRFSESRLHYSEAARLYAQLGSRRGLLHAENGLGLVELWAHNMDPTVTHLSTALSIARELRDRVLVGLLLSNLGEAWLEFGDPDRALPLLEESIDVLREVGDRVYELDAMNFLGRTLCQLGRLPEARATLEETSAGMREISLAANYGGHMNLDFARLQLAEGAPADALVSSQRAGSAFRELRNPQSEATAWALSGRAFLQLQRWDEAASFLGRAVAGHRDSDSMWQLSNDLHDLAIALDRIGEHQKARGCRTEALDLLGSFADPSANALRDVISAELDSRSSESA
ncbi:tetratricopeptide (TPR) repeat protein [Catenulispora sp. GP43]|uniref:ATP-binding protein n=1 Tax=Catenulispora sp. GP43 TaxID=3156263 RepID=UPI0035138B93